ncbi:MAG: YggS family pyridoxal phosphate-dependent enzyme [Planctomycetes bacterium]|nr:YggS family pyridoxal phosphate-dependent enzyme [Planctomycetota bacterium]
MFPTRSCEFLRARLAQVRSEIHALEAACGRPQGSVQLLPVTKTVDWETTANLYALGERDFAENRADALVAKAREFSEKGMHPRWHFIGPLQRNKARRVVRVASVLHSVHSMALIEALDRITQEEDRALDLYLQVHTSGDEAKQGFGPAELRQAAAQVARSPRLSAIGLMTMGPLEDPDGSGASRAFEACRELGSQLTAEGLIGTPDGRCALSMGMSGDLPQAVRAGSTLVRVGSALFL